ncbi:MAG: hypothetical protein R3183_09265 [Oleiphilaceae bacterium]|nr:hypothetical protein [Oleiphilaceae bacterium]
MARKAKLSCRVYQGEDAPEQVLNAMWRLRLDFLHLKRDESEDRQRFTALLRKPHTQLLTFWDATGALQGFFTLAFNPVSREGRKALLLHSKYYYVRPAFRGHPKITSAAWRLLPGVIMRYGVRRLYFVAFSFPTSFVSLHRTFGRVMVLQDAATPEWERLVLNDYVAGQAGQDWDEGAKLIRNQNVPFGEDRPASRSVATLRERYEALNPEWEQGCSLPIMMKFDLPTIKAVLHNNVRRALR